MRVVFLGLILSLSKDEASTPWQLRPAQALDPTDTGV